MADSLGSLVISLEANIASFEAGMRSATATMETSTGRMKAGAEVAMHAVEGFLAALAVDRVFEWSKGIVESASNLDRLSKTTGSSVESLSRLSNIAKVTGTDFGTFQSLLTRLTVGMAGVEDQSGKASKALDYLGVTARDPATALQEVADKLATYADGAGKAALARDLFGKGGPAFLDTLAKMAEAHNVSATVTERDAAAAEALENQIRTLSVQATFFKDIVLKTVVPALSEAITSFTDARAAGLGFFDALTLGGLYNSSVQKEIRQATESIKDLKKVIASDPNPTYLPGFQKELDDEQRKLDLLIAKRDRIIGNNVAAMGWTGDSRDIRANAKPLADYSGAPDEKEKKKVDEFANALTALGKEAALANLATDALFSSVAITDAERHLAELEASPAWAKFNDVQREKLSIAYANVAAVERANAAEAAQAKSAGQYAADRAQEAAEWEQKVAKAAEGFDATIVAMDRETASLGVNSQARRFNADMAALQDARAKGLITSDADLLTAQEKLTAAYNRQAAGQAALDAAKDANKAWLETARTIGDALSSALDGAFQKGWDAGKALRDGLESLFKKLVLQPTLQAVGNGVAGVFGGSGGAGPGGTSGGFSLGNVGSTLSSITSGFANFGTSVSALGANLDLVAAGALDAVGGLAGLAGSVGAVLGPIAAVAGIAYLAYTLLSQPRGGPKDGGYASAGNTSGMQGLDPDNNRFYTPTTADTTIGKITTGLSTAFTTALLGLGGKDSTAGFAAGYDVDPKGTANTRLSFGATVDGKSVYSVRNKDEGQGTDQLDADLPLEAQRALLAALQASDLPADIAAIMRSIDAATATSDAIQNVIGIATAFKTVGDVLARNPVDDALAAIAASSAAVTSSLKAQVDAARNLASTYQGTAAQSASLATATLAVYNAELQVIAQSRQVAASLGDLFASTTRDFIYGTLDKAGKNKYLQDDELRLKQQLATATDPAEIKSLTEKMVADLQQSWQLLTPEEQKTQLNQYTQAVDAINKQSDARIKAVEASAQTLATSVIKDLQALLQKAAKDNADAAEKQRLAAENALAASKVPSKVNVTVDLQNGRTEVNGGADSGGGGGGG